MAADDDADCAFTRTVPGGSSAGFRRTGGGWFRVFCFVHGRDPESYPFGPIAPRATARVRRAGRQTGPVYRRPRRSAVSSPRPTASGDLHGSYRRAPLGGGHATSPGSSGEGRGRLYTRPCNRPPKPPNELCHRGSRMDGPAIARQRTSYLRPFSSWRQVRLPGADSAHLGHRFRSQADHLFRVRRSLIGAKRRVFSYEYQVIGFRSTSGCVAASVCASILPSSRSSRRGARGGRAERRRCSDRRSLRAIQRPAAGW